ncbi:hypothetical protein CYMTET_4064 [Cymbomonas tetramitiformis]|uniref:Uncharacterized protein n=1 Tax=Cymbomonas tetramitiformis TaxID=36881 RepID=A0AAE0H2D2_9CHLO|nr:hypothetical protein CYMTET_4064 [Cymbomonas tetramitiformis]
MDLLEDEKESPTMEELGERIYTAHNIFPITTYSPFADTMVQLRASMDRWSRTLRYTVELRPCKRSSRLSRRRCILGLTGSLVTDSIMTTWLNEFDFQKANKAVINTYAKASAKVLTFRDRRGTKGKGQQGRRCGQRQLGAQKRYKAAEGHGLGVAPKPKPNFPIWKALGALCSAGCPTHE